MMEGKSYLIGGGGELEIHYHLSGKIARLEFSDSANLEQIEWALDKLPLLAQDTKGLDNYMTEIGKKVKVVKVPADVSFSRFWDAYGHKKSKVEAKSAWERLNKADKVKALHGVQKYRLYSTSKGYELAYPAKFLNKRMFEDYQ